MSDQSCLFFALLPPASLAASLKRLACDEQIESHELITRTEQFHLSLRYLGQTDSAMMRCLLNHAGSIRAKKFTLQLNQTGYWKKSRVSWCAPESLNASLQLLQNKLEQLCQQCGAKPETKEFKPHLTLLKKLSCEHKTKRISLAPWPVSD
ncbi:MAG: RNA 2',3'-cyclic phosphodiesterase, partial [Gammaproteobacteria bacterium]|nr:RNA 2',3'-cyclic phosphodiesterase [Gammaproteobacteria bacterium]